MNNDLISRSALKRDLEISPYNDYDDYLRTERLIDDAPTVEPKWIPVTERLPDVGQVVIVTDDRGKVFEYVLNPLNVDKYTTDKWRFLGRNIIAWMPLPEPYKRGDV